MAVRKAKAYSKKQRTAFTRKSQKVKHLNYIKAVPLQKISKFFMGEILQYEQGKLKNVIYMVSEIKLALKPYSEERFEFWEKVHKIVYKNFIED